MLKTAQRFCPGLPWKCMTKGKKLPNLIYEFYGTIFRDFVIFISPRLKRATMPLIL